MKKYVIARSNGPSTINGVEQEYRNRALQRLIIGKKYEVIKSSIHNGYQWVDFDLKVNPRIAKFFIEVIDETGRKASYWNDYFYSTEEERDLKFDTLGI